MSTNHGKFIHRLSVNNLRQYFAFRQIDLSAIDWQAKETPLKKSVAAFIETLPNAQRTTVHLDAEAVLELAGEAGDLAIVDAISSHAAMLEEFGRSDSAEGRALWLFINHPKLFERACWVSHFDQSRAGRNWSGFVEPAGSKFDPSDVNLSAFADACADVYRERDGFRGSVDSDHFGRLPSWRDDEDTGSISQVTIYKEDRPRSRMVWEGQNRQRQVHRDARELHLTYCAADGAIDVVAMGGATIRKKIVRLFARHVLGVDVDPEKVQIREIDLSILADRSVLTKNIQGSIAEVELKSVRFLAMDEESSTIVHYRRATPIYDEFERGRLQKPGYEIDRVELVFIFHPDACHRRGKRVTVTLTAPNGSSVKDGGQIYRPAIEEFLERSCIYRPIGRDDEQIEAAE